MKYPSKTTEGQLNKKQREEILKDPEIYHKLEIADLTIKQSELFRKSRNRQSTCIC